jgi:YbbR domain-containing protein
MFRAIGQFLKHNWFLKLFSILLASLLWLTIASEGNYIIPLTVPISFRDTPNRMETIGETATEVHLRLQGSRNVLDNLSPSDVTAVISLVGQAPGPKNFPLNETNVQGPGGVEILRYDPPRMQFSLERTMERTLPVRPMVEGLQAEGFLQGEISVTPTTVLVEGPESEVRRLEYVPTETVNIEGARADVTRRVEVAILDPLIRSLAVSSHEVVIEIHEVPAEDLFRVARDPGLDDGDWSVEPAQIMVQIGGPRSLINAFDAEGLVFTVDTAELDPETDHLVQPSVPNLADEFFIVGYDPPQVEVRFTQQ